MQLSISTWMMIFFILSLVVSLWKVYAFLPNKQLEDDDKNNEATSLLNTLMLKIIVKKEGNITVSNLLTAMKEDESFNKTLFWRFNENRLKQLLNAYYSDNSNTSSIKNIYITIKH